MWPCLHVPAVLAQNPSLPSLPKGDTAKAAPVHGWIAALCTLRPCCDIRSLQLYFSVQRPLSKTGPVSSGKIC